ncbi:hypothetical protein RvY_18231-1 [Ramazzottius varieornatus]|uniref:Uncharacterized protein n=1 Tax=Ramazzottius varieornatus TaxID=947166 RepID=A0A1D1W504_RAMVA|nr:hypothetical protein RvY_18231-1 [Ramazzottius varieornatus]
MWISVAKCVLNSEFAGSFNDSCLQSYLRLVLRFVLRCVLRYFGHLQLWSSGSQYRCFHHCVLQLVRPAIRSFQYSLGFLGGPHSALSVPGFLVQTVRTVRFGRGLLVRSGQPFSVKGRLLASTLHAERKVLGYKENLQ